MILFLRFLRSFCFDLEDISNTRESVSSISKHLKVRQNTPLRVVFSTLFSVFGNVMKHALSCLIYYDKNVMQRGLNIIVLLVSRRRMKSKFHQWSNYFIFGGNVRQ